MLLTAGSVLLGLLNVTATLLIGRRRQAGWWIALAAQLPWSAYDIATSQYGFLLITAAALPVYLSGLRRLRAARREPPAGLGRAGRQSHPRARHTTDQGSQGPGRGTPLHRLDLLGYLSLRPAPIPPHHRSGATMPDHDAPAMPAAQLMNREQAARKALEPHGLTLVIFPAPDGADYGIARPGLPGAPMGRFPDLASVEEFAAALPAAPPAAGEEQEREWRENCPRCWYPILAPTEQSLLRRLLDHITYEHLLPAQPNAVEYEGAYRGMIRIEWPAANPASPYTALRGCLLTITDAVTGEPISTVTNADITIHADAARQVTAELTMLAGVDGEPLPDGKPAADGDGIRHGVYTYAVTEMTIRETRAR
jgi:hypothetical protein